MCVIGCVISTAMLGFSALLIRGCIAYGLGGVTDCGLPRGCIGGLVLPSKSSTLRILAVEAKVGRMLRSHQESGPLPSFKGAQEGSVSVGQSKGHVHEPNTGLKILLAILSAAIWRSVFVIRLPFTNLRPGSNLD